MRQNLILLACSVALSGCATHFDVPASISGPEGGCRLPVVKMTANEYDNPDEGASRFSSYAAGTGGQTEQPGAGGTLVDVFRSTSRVKRSAQHTNVLVLSGGSLHGAFGAGLFYGWMNSHAPGDEPVPSYDVITGVSTGALQSTFIFLNTSSDPRVRQGAQRDADRLQQVRFLASRLSGDTNGVAAPGSSYLADLAQDYMPDRESDLLHLRPLQRMSPNKIGMLELINHQSVATMAPLRQVIAAELGPETIRGVAAEAQRGRKLLVAIADLGNVYGYAADLTMLAQLAADPEHQDPKDLVRVFPDYRPNSGRNLIDAARQCYVDALVASSSVPPGVPVVPIEIIREGKDGHILDPDYHPGAPRPAVPSNRVAGQHPFVDGGAAFAVFFSQIAAEIPDRSGYSMDLIVNGSYFPQEWDRVLDERRRNRKLRDVKVSSADVLLQTAEVLQTQVRLFSVQDARRWAKDSAGFRWAFIDNRQITSHDGDVDTLRPWGGQYRGTPLDWPYKRDSKGQSQSCRQWHEIDAKEHNPMEFFPTYMRCVLDYGLKRGRDPARRWNLCISADPAKCPTNGTPRRRENDPP
jgi:hypothetical protein